MLNLERRFNLVLIEQLPNIFSIVMRIFDSSTTAKYGIDIPALLD